MRATTSLLLSRAFACLVSVHNLVLISRSLDILTRLKIRQACGSCLNDRLGSPGRFELPGIQIRRLDEG